MEKIDYEELISHILKEYDENERIDITLALYINASDENKKWFNNTKRPFDSHCKYKVGDTLYYEHDFPREYEIVKISDDCKILYVANFETNKSFKVLTEFVDDIANSNFYTTIEKLKEAKYSYHQHMLNFYKG